MESRKKQSFARQRSVLLQEEGDTIREYKAMPEENFLSSWLREDGKGKTKREVEKDKEVREDVGKKGKRVREKGEV